MMSRLMPAAMILIAFPLFADSPMTRIMVHVQNRNGRPVDRASVIVNFVEGRSIVKLGKKVMTHWEVRTNQEGVAKIPSIPPGKVRIQVIARGYQTFGDMFEVDGEEKTIPIRLNPPQAQHSEHQ